MTFWERLKQSAQGTNFYIALLVIVGGFWSSVSVEDVTGFVNPAFATLAGFFALRNKVKGQAPVSAKDWWANPNTKAYLGILAVQLIPGLPVEFLNSLWAAISGALGGNWQTVISSVISAVTVLYFWLKGSGAKPAAAVIFFIASGSVSGFVLLC